MPQLRKRRRCEPQPEHGKDGCSNPHYDFTVNLSTLPGVAQLVGAWKGNADEPEHHNWDADQ